VVNSDSGADDKVTCRKCDESEAGSLNKLGSWCKRQFDGHEM